MARSREQPDEAETEVRPETGRTPRFRESLAPKLARFKSFGVVRLLLMLIGAGAFAVGLLNAFRSEASTTPLIVGAVLLLAALVIGPELREIRARHGETEVSLLRDVETRLEAVTIESKTEEELRAEISELRVDVQRAREAVERGDVAMPGDTAQSRVYVASHSVADGKVVLTLDVPAGAAVGLPESYRCVVRDPDMRTASSPLRSPPYSVLPMRREITLVYPDEFEGAELLTPGTYLAEWRRRTLLSVAVSAITGDPVIARDAWTVDSGRPRQQADSPGGASSESAGTA